MFDIHLFLEPNGWGYVVVELGQRTVANPISYLTDSPSDLAAMALELLQPAPFSPVSMVFAGEPGSSVLQWRSYTRPWGRQERLEFGQQRGHRVEIEASASVTAVTTARTIERALTTLNRTHGVERYSELWGWEFPEVQLATLQHQLQSLNNA